MTGPSKHIVFVKFYFATIIMLLLCKHVAGGIKNKGALIKTTSSVHLKISGYYAHESNGKLINDGTLHFSGNWINNDLYTGEENINSTGTVKFAGNSTLSGTAPKECFEDISINPGASLTINPNIFCHIFGDVIREDASAQLILDSDSTHYGCVYFENDIADSVQINLYLKGNQWTFMTIPFDDYTPTTLFKTALNNTISIACFDENKRATTKQDWTLCNANDTLIPGRGYIIWSDKDTTIATIGILQRERTLNLDYSNTSNGYFHNGWNLVGNYQPTPIDIYKPNSEDRPIRTNVDAAIYVYNKETDDYWTYVDGLGINMPPDGSKLAPYQAFFMKSNNSVAQINFKGSERIVDNSITLRNTSISNDIIRIKIEDKSGQSQTIIRYKEEATEDFDSNFDAYLFNSSQSQPNIYSYANDIKLAVNSLPYSHYDQIPIAIYTNSPDSFQISWTIENANRDYDLYLIDKKTSIIYLMNEATSSATFSSHKKLMEDRYMVFRVKNNFALLNKDLSNILSIVQNGSTLELNTNTYINVVSVYTIDGKMLCTARNATSKIRLNTGNYKGVVLIKVTANNSIQTFKQIIH